MRQKLRNLLPFHGVVSGGTATIELAVPEAMRVHAANIIFKSDNAGTVQRRNKATMLTQLVNVQMFINNKPQRQPTIAKIFEDLEMRNGSVKDGIVPILFSREERQLKVEREATALFAGAGDFIRFSVELGACTLPELDLELDVEPFNSNGNEGSLRDMLSRRGGRRQVIETIRSDTVNVGKTGELNLSLDPEGRDVSCIKLRTTDTDFIEVYRGVDKKWEGTPADYDRWLEDAGYTPQAGVIHFFPEAWGGSTIVDWYQYRGKKLIFKLNMTAANSFDIDIHEMGDAIR